MSLLRFCLLLLSVAAGFAISPALAQKRVALVVGNSAYQFTSPLANPANDARLMSQTLERAGFEVITLIDADRDTLKRAMVGFGRVLREGSTEAGLFYYAGHGMQVKGENYLVPVSANIASEDEVDLETININDFLSVMNSSQTKVNIVILDACRNNPFASSGRSASRGLAPVDAPKGTYIAYATSPGEVALDGTGSNSPYTEALSAAMLEPGVPIERVFKNARARVLASTGEQQLPWETSSITGEFFFVGGSGAEQAQQPAGEQASQIDAPEAPGEAQEQVAAAETQGSGEGGSIWQSLQLKLANKKDAEQPAGEAPSGGEEKKGTLFSSLSLRQEDPLDAPSYEGETCLDALVEVFDGEPCVTSVLEGSRGLTYGPENLFDDDPKTAWVEGVDGDGIGEMMVVHFDGKKSPSTIYLRNGYTKNDDIYAKNGRAREIEITDSSGRALSVELADDGDWQAIDLEKDAAITWVAIEIRSVYPGSKYADTAISELRIE
jgi:hypothetical protein